MNYEAQEFAKSSDEDLHDTVKRYFQIDAIGIANR